MPRINFGVEGGFLRFMPAVIEELDIMGLKAFDAKFPEARYLIAVFTPSTGELDCLVDAAYLHRRAHGRDDRRGDPLDDRRRTAAARSASSAPASRRGRTSRRCSPSARSSA